jgi:uncharacterized protein YjbI with pentapeptide repeats
MKLQILTASLLIATFGFSYSAQAQNMRDVRRLINSGNCRDCDLRDADLRGRDLRNADLQGADLQNADLRNANLRGANLRDANLRGADLGNANLQNANTRNAVFTGANLRGTGLEGQYGDRFSDRFDRRDRDRIGRRGNYFNQDEIRRIYREVLDREPDLEGYETWSEAFRNGASTRDVRSRIANSDEARTRINQIYREVLGRDVDPSGLRNWQNRLASGSSLTEVRSIIASTPEARNRPNQTFPNQPFPNQPFPPSRPGVPPTFPGPIQPPPIQR